MILPDKDKFIASELEIIRRQLEKLESDTEAEMYRQSFKIIEDWIKHMRLALNGY